MFYYLDFYGITVTFLVHMDLIKESYLGEKRGTPANPFLKEEVMKFWRGEDTSLDVSLEGLDDNIRNILMEVKRIPLGKVSSYGDVSLRVFKDKNHSRLVGHALSINPVPLFVPCHRVVHSNGEVKGFTGSLSLKIKLLELEGVKISNGKVDKAFFANL